MSALEETIYRIVKRALKDGIEEEKENGVLETKSERPKIKYSRPSLKQKDPLSIIRPDELCEILSVSRATLWRMEKEKQLPHKIKIGTRSVGWLRRDIEEWLGIKREDI